MSAATVPDGAPDRPRAAELLLGFAPAPGRWRAAVVATLALVLPAAGLTLAGWGHEATLVALGAFTAMYGTRRPYRARVVFLGVVGVLLVGAATLGALVGTAGVGTGADVLLVVTLAFVSAIAVFGANALEIGPPGGFFLVLAAGIAAHVVTVGATVAEVTAATACGAAAAWCVSVAPILWRSQGPQRRAVDTAVRAVDAYATAATTTGSARRARTVAARTLHDAWACLHDARLRDGALFERLYDTHLRFAATIADPTAPPPTRGIAHVPLGRTEAADRLRRHAHTLSAQVLVTGRVLIAVVASGVLAYALGTGRADWAMVSAVLVLHGSVERVRGTYRALHRIVGTVAGVGVFAVIALGAPDGLVLVAVLGVLQFVIEMLVVRHYGAAVAFITALVLLISEPPGHLDAAIVADRVLDTMIGAGVAVAVLWLTGRRFDADVLPYEMTRTSASTRTLADLLDTGPAVTAQAARARRTLQLDLLETAAGADVAYQEAPSRARTLWPQYAQVQDVGYAVLARCWLQGDDRRPLPPDLRARVDTL